MNEIAKNEMRNYLSDAGFFVFALSILVICSVFLFGQGENIYSLQNSVDIISGILILLSGALLAVLGKRDLTAITFLMLGIMTFMRAVFGIVMTASGNFADMISVSIVLQVFYLTLPCIILTAKDKAKYPLALIIGLLAVFTLIGFISPANLTTTVLGYTHILLAVVSLYLAFACASERINLPLGKTLTAEQETDFKKSASALGYLTLTASMAVWAFYYIFNTSEGFVEYIYALDGVYAFLMILIAILLFAVAKMRFTPVMFLLAGALLAVSSVIGDRFEFILGILFIVLGIFAVLRTESRILPGLMFIIYGISYFIGPVAVGAGITVLAIIVNGLPALIALYLAVATFSQKKLPLF
ncbi:MAG TPA: hypothetical protein O0X56_06755 [Methanocorpusculum sp.]|nr:hypothetical protein [Methanocorpusculum sp.]